MVQHRQMPVDPISQVGLAARCRKQAEIATFGVDSWNDPTFGVLTTICGVCTWATCN